MKTMLAAVYLEPGRVEAVERTLPELNQSEVLIKVHAVGICGSDLAIVSGKHPRARPPLVLGHEVAGEIAALTETGRTDLDVGDKVTLYPLISCGECYACRHGAAHVCRTLRVIGFDRDGGMADYVKVPASNVIKIPRSMSYETGALLEPLAVAVHAVGMTQVHDTDTVVVMGAGPIGLMTAMVLKHSGVSKLYVTDVNPFRLKLAKSLQIASIDALEEDVVERMREMTDGEGADVVFEAAGVQPAAEQMTELIRPRGKIVNVSVFKEPPRVDMRAINFKEITLIGSRVYTEEDFQTAIHIGNELPLQKIVTHQLPFTRVAGAIELLKRGEDACKVLLKPETPQSVQAHDKQESANGVFEEDED